MTRYSKPRSAVRSAVRSAGRPVTGAGGLPPIASFVAVGDSITDRMSDENSDFSFLEMNFSGWGAALEVLSERSMLSAARNNAFATDRSHGYSGITADQYVLGGPAWLNGVTPIDDAVTALNSADCAIVHIGTNDIADTAENVAANVQAVWDDLVATGKPVIGTDILQRTASYSGWTATLRDKVDAINDLLRSSWASHGLKAYRRWNDLIDKDSNGYAEEYEFPNDGIHPTQRVGLKLGQDLNSILSGTLAAPTIPADDSSSWVTPNPEVDGDTSGIATDWKLLGITAGTHANFSKVTDGEGKVWQRISRLNASAFNQQGLYCRATSGGAGIPAAGTTCRAVARVKVISGDITGVSLDVQQVGAPPASDWASPFQIGGGTSLASPILERGELLLFSEPFDVAAGVTQLWCLVNSSCSGAGVIDFRQAGIFEV